MITGIPQLYVSLQLNFHSLLGTATVNAYPGSYPPSGTAPVGSATVNYTSPAATFSVYANGTPTAPGTITVTVSIPPSSLGYRELFSIDSIGYAWLTYTLNTTLYTQCGSPKDKYEFGFNGQMKSNEIAGVGNVLDFGARNYNSRIGRWTAIDPLVSKYPSVTPYCFGANNPILIVDQDGREIWISHQIVNKGKQTKVVLVQYKDGKLYNKDGSLYKGSDGYLREMQSDLNTLKSIEKTNSDRINYLEGVSNKHLITNYDSKNEGTNHTNQPGKSGPNGEKPEYRSVTYMDRSRKPDKFKNELVDDQVITLSHEVAGHAYDREKGSMKTDAVQDMYPGAETNCEEVEAVRVENLAREACGYDQRTEYSGEKIPTQELQQCPNQ